MRRASIIAIAVTALAPLAPAQDGATFDSGGVKIFYTDEGRGEPVLLIHGYAASGNLNWRLPGIVRELAADYRVITLDNRGHGKSDKPEDESEYGIKMVGDAVGLLDHLGIERAHVVGYSMGGMIALKLLTIHPERVISASIGGMGWIEAGGERARSFREARVASGVGASGPLAACRRGFYELGITEEELRAIRTPMRLFVGSEDGLLDRAVASFRKVRPDVPVTIIEGANHTNCVLRPELREGIKRFIGLNPAESDP